LNVCGANAHSESAALYTYTTLVRSRDRSLESYPRVSRGLALWDVPGLQSAVYAAPDGQCPHRILRLEPQLAVPREIPLAPAALERLNLAVAEVHRRTGDHFGHRDQHLLARRFLLLRVLELLIERDEVTVRD